MNPKSPSKLLNSMIEVCVVVGMDQDTGLVPIPQEKDTLETGLTLFNTDYQAHIVAALSGQSVSFPYVETEIEGEPFYHQSAVIAPTPPVKGGKKVLNSKAKLPILQDVIDGLTPFCFPDGAQVKTTKQPSVVHALVLTDIEGNRMYCVCLTFFREFMAKQMASVRGNFELIYMEQSDVEVVGDSGYLPCYVPVCCCLISKWPYFDLMKECLSSLLPQFPGDPRHFRNTLMKFVSQLAMIPVPPVGSMGIEFDFCGMRHLVKPAQNLETRVVDMELHYPFLCFSTDDILLLISCILTQQRLVFMASSYLVIIHVIESLFTYIQPFVWSWTYVPILPWFWRQAVNVLHISNLLDLVEAPGVYIMGCNSRYHDQIKTVMDMDQLSCVIIANIDEGTVTLAQNLKVPLLPTFVTDLFKLRMSKAQLQYDLYSAERPILMCFEDRRKERQEFTMKFETLVLAASREMMKRLLGDISSHTSLDEGYFDKDEFIASKLESDQEFYMMACNSHAFSSFLNDWIACPEKRKFFQEQSATSRPGPLRKRSSSSTKAPIIVEDVFSSSLSPGKSLATLMLPSFTLEGLHKGSFYQRCLDSLNKKIETLDRSAGDVLAGCLYLRGMFHLACGQHIELNRFRHRHIREDLTVLRALEDFFALYSRNSQLFPTETVRAITEKLSDEELQLLQSKSFYRIIKAMRHRFMSTGHLHKERKGVVTSAVPSGPLGEDDFVKHVNMLQICISREAGLKLFRCLTVNRKSQAVDRETFMGFYASLNQANTEASAVTMPGVTMKEDEVVLKISHNLIKTDRGMGRIVLTVHRLFFMLDGTHKWEAISEIEKIDKVEHHKHYVVLPPGVPALKISGSYVGPTPFIVCLKEERDFWLECIRGLQAAHKICHDLKDDQIVKQAAQNIILADALRRSGCQMDAVYNILYLCKVKPEELSDCTKKALVARISPSPQDMEQMTVESMIFVSESHEHYASVWCALGSPGSGLIGIVNADTWQCMSQFRQGKYRVSNLLLVGGKQVWAASLDTIYIITINKKQADQQLHGHVDYISHMIERKEADGTSTVWSAGCDGHIIGWDPETLAHKREFKLKNVKRLFSFAPVGNHIWYGTKNDLRVSDLNGENEKTLTMCDKTGRAMSIGCMCAVKSTNKVWTGCDTESVIAVWNSTTLKYKIHDMEGDTGLTNMICLENQVWVGGRSGRVFILDAESCAVQKVLQLHNDRVRSMCITDTGHVLTGPGSKDGRIAVWKSHLVQHDVDATDMGFTEL